jgi:serine/threonine protein phosphatase PrpC
MSNSAVQEVDDRQPYQVAAASTSMREVNEDSYFVGCLKPSMHVQEASSGVRLRGEMSGSNRGILMIVADGVGGLNQGALASKLAVEEAASFTMEHVTPPRWRSYSRKASYSREVAERLSIPGIRGQLADVVAASDHLLRQEAITTGELGSTLTLGYLLWPLLYVAHVGDSRAYVIRNKQLLQITKDHSLGAQATSLGLDHIADEWHDALWNCLGDVNRCAAPDLHKVVLDIHDRWMFTSDGFHKFMTPKEIVDLALSSGDAKTACNALIRRAVHNGANDDVTVILGHYSG